ncbi:MAG: type I-MYXAN CRISPR-associated protein Cmx8 [Deltaproteobacteria bacterium]|nr:type I-MYXAN CRISPR-associated protein Cmx8 [Deltaproteobacteria bacterium]
MASTKAKREAKPKKAGRNHAKKESKPATEAPLELTWSLAELPSAQHKTGLAGLVLMVRWLEQQPRRKGLCELTRLDADGATLRVDRTGMRELFDETYAAAAVEREEGKLRKHPKTKAEIPPLRTVEREVKDERGKLKKKTFYAYPATEPRGAFLADLDDPGSGKSGLWIKMWRSMVWSILRAIPATRGPYEKRAEGPFTDDAEEAFGELTSGADQSTDLPSTYYIGAQAMTAESVPFGDRVRFRFLLHFWPFAVGLYVPGVLDAEGKRDFPGYALAFPDLADLETGCDEIYRVLKARGTKALAYLPVEAVVDLPAEGALDLAGRLFKRLSKKTGDMPGSDLLLGIDVIHVEREGNNVRVRSSARVEPTPTMTDEYERLRKRYWDPFFRRQILANHIAGRPLHLGFNRLFQTHPYERFFARQDSYFRHDAEQFFKEDEREVNA